MGHLVNLIAVSTHPHLDTRLGLVICGGNVTTADVAGWVQRFSATSLPRRPAAAVR